MDVSTALGGLIAITVGTYLVTVVHRATQHTLSEEGNGRPEARLVVWPRWLLGAVVGLLAVLLLYRIRAILTPFLVGGVVAYALNPLIEVLGKRGIPRQRAISLVFLLLLALVVVGALLVIPVVVAEAQDLVTNYAGYAQQAQGSAARLEAMAVRYAGRVGIVPEDVFRALGAVGGYLQRWGLQLLQSAPEWLKQSSSLFLGLLVIMPIAAFWLLRDYHVVGRLLLRLAPERQRASTVEVAGEVNHIVGSYLLGMATMVLVVGVYATVLLLAMGARFAVLLGLLTGLLSIIPYLGYPTAMIVVATTMGVTGAGGVRIAIVIGLLLLGNLISDNVVYPRVIGTRLGLHPLVIIFALMAGGALFNFAGMILAVPVAGVIKALLLRFWPEVFAPEG
jgi:predicted PurR-regulated permease PerM